MLGFVSSYNFYGLTTNTDVSEGTDAEGLIAWIDTYCRAHPLDQLAQAVVMLIDELRRRNGVH